ncbi:MAG: SGNH/GDSL hydrolase family protein [Gammaproteobacteria bacterium]|nr:SGNH/GDSL hydrolase family protein [Gammaproteobacteria bacterium]
MKPLIKNIALGLVVASSFLLVIELILSFFEIDYRPENVLIKNEFDPELRSVEVPAYFAAKTAGTIAFNTTANPLTYPDSDLIFKVRPNPDGQKIFGYEGINSFGYRGDFDFSTQAKKVVVLGDSCVFGWGLPKLEDTFPHLLESLFKGEGWDYRVYNLGQPGYSTTQGLKIHQNWMGQIQPDIVVLYFGWNDIWPTPLLTDSQTIRMAGLNKSVFLQEIRRLYIYGLMYKILETLNVLPQQERYSMETAGYKPRVPRDEVIRNYSRMIKGMQAIIILPPFGNINHSIAQLMDDYKHDVKASMQDKTTVLQLTEMEGNSPETKDYYTKDGFHPNRQGSLHIAESLYDVITHGKATIDSN